jgi:hypothetical protein
MISTSVCMSHVHDMLRMLSGKIELAPVDFIADFVFS